QAEFIPADILNHPFRQEITTLLKWKVRGLEPQYDQTTKAYLFKPDGAVTRGEMALILEDILIKLTGDESLARAYLGHERSPFPDVRPTAPIYNAVMNATTRGLMEPELSGEFNPGKPVDGAEAILAIRVLKQRMNIN
ncbi:MAG: S-layer homology domain-containing protein, partial [Aquificaceae bacterium]|nr:S-layer homology domain-containing protein [Aquificaceae bacterium]